MDGRSGRQRFNWRLSSVLALALFAFILPEAFNDPRAGGFGISGAWAMALAESPSTFLARNDELLFIFNWSAGSNVRSPIVAGALVGCRQYPP